MADPVGGGGSGGGESGRTYTVAVVGSHKAGKTALVERLLFDEHDGDSTSAAGAAGSGDYRQTMGADLLIRQHVELTPTEDNGCVLFFFFFFFFPH